MPLLDYLTYSAGFVPHADATAQNRCFAYLEKAIQDLDDKIAQSPQLDQNLTNLQTIYTDLRNVMETAAGSMRLDRANNFWRYWDKNKNRIIKLTENTDDEYVVQDVLGTLEDGRYIQS